MLVKLSISTELKSQQIKETIPEFLVPCLFSCFSFFLVNFSKLRSSFLVTFWHRNFRWIGAIGHACDYVRGQPIINLLKPLTRTPAIHDCFSPKSISHRMEFLMLSEIPLINSIFARGCWSRWVVCMILLCYEAGIKIIAWMDLI